MSIVISVIEKNKKFYIASDKRGKRRGVARDDYKKVYRLLENIYFGMTGVYEAGLAFFNHVKDIVDVTSRDNLITVISGSFDSFFRNNKPDKLAIVVGGRDIEGNFFIWQKTTQGETNFIEGSSENIGLAVNSNDKREIFSEYLKGQIISGLSVKEAIIKTIEYASEVDLSISKEYDLYEVDTG